MKKGKAANKDVVIYQTKSGALELRGDYTRETVWATQTQIAELFAIDRTVATKHINNIFKDKEIDQKSNVQKMHIANSDKPVTLYSLDVILAVGYRTNSKIAITFRQWATKTLRSHIVEGYTVNRTVLERNYGQYTKALQHLEKLAPESMLDATDTLTLVRLFADTWVSLDAYDKAELPKKGATKKQVQFAVADLSQALASFRGELMRTQEATDLFAAEKHAGALGGIVGNILQSFGGNDLYGTVEEKAAHLLYFIVKDHPFNDGNKRSGAFSFIWYLQKAGKLRVTRFTPETLTTLTLLVAESKPKDKEHIIGLILLLVNK